MGEGKRGLRNFEFFGVFVWREASVKFEFFKRPPSLGALGFYIRVGEIRSTDLLFITSSDQNTPPLFFSIASIGRRRRQKYPCPTDSVSFFGLGFFIFYLTIYQCM
jgi:hypothetical protein